MMIAEAEKKLYIITMKTNHHFFFAVCFIFFVTIIVSHTPSCTTAATCAPTQPDMMGPFYKPGSPERSRVGQGYILSGAVRSSKDCSPVKSAKIEFWLTGPDGEYDDDHRATVYADSSGTYRFESNEPKPYSGRPPHIHIRVSAENFKTLVTQHYPVTGKTKSSFDLVLMPANE